MNFLLDFLGSTLGKVVVGAAGAVVAGAVAAVVIYNKNKLKDLVNDELKNKQPEKATEAFCARVKKKKENGQTMKYDKDFRENLRKDVKKSAESVETEIDLEIKDKDDNTLIQDFWVNVPGKLDEDIGIGYNLILD